MALRPSSETGSLHRESRLYDHRDDVPRPSIQWWQGRIFESQHAGPLPVGGWRSPDRREALIEPFGCRGFLGDIRSRNRRLRRSAECVLSRGTIALRIRHDALMAPLHALLLNNGLLDQPILLIEPHRSSHGIWRIKFAYDDFEPLSMDAQQALQLAISLHGIGEDELAGEINEAVGRAAHYETM